MGENEPEVIYRTVFKCSNCGAIVHKDDIACNSCGAKLGENRSTKHPPYTEAIIKRMVYSVPNGMSDTYTREILEDCTIVSTPSGGIGMNVANHHIALGPERTENPLTWRAIALSISVLALEGYSPDVMLIGPYQMYDLMMNNFSDTFVNHDQRKFDNNPGVIGFIAGMEVVVSIHMPAGKVLIFDSQEFDPTDIKMNKNAAVLLYGGGTSIGGGGQW